MWGEGGGQFRAHKLADPRMATTPAPRPGPQAPQGPVPSFSEARVKELTALAEYLMGKVDFSRGLIGENQHPYCRGEFAVARDARAAFQRSRAL